MRHPRQLILLAAVTAMGSTAVGTMAATPPAAAPGSSFEPRVAVGMTRGEPRIAVAPDGTLYAAAAQPLGRDSVFVSSDSGLSWSAVPGTNVPLGGGDDDVMVTPDGTVWLAGQEPGSLCESVARGVAGASAFVTNPLACGTLGSADRPWLAATQRGPNGQRLFLYFNLNGTHTIEVSDDGGVTWTTAGTLPSGHFPGYLVADDASGFVYAVTTVRSNGHDSEVVVYRSADDGSHWTRYDVAPMTTGDLGLSHVYLAMDSAGTLYTAWADNLDGSAMRIWFSRSTDHAQTWSAPRPVSGPTGTHVFPAIAAGSPGRVFIAWYETPVTGDPNTIDASAPWQVAGVSSLDGGASFADTTVSADVMHHGPICTKGGSCNGNRLLLDFISAVIDPQGRAHVVWSDDTAPGIDAVVGPVVTYTARSDAAQGTGVGPLG